jgi:hypothetical protein
MNDSFIEYYRCPERFIHFSRKGDVSLRSGFFRFGEDSTCFGTYVGADPSEAPTESLHDARPDISLDNGTIYLPFDPSEVVRNLRYELYASDWRGKFPLSTFARMYYFARPLLPVAVRKHLQKFHLVTRANKSFPRWPVDFSVDNLFSQLMLLVLKSNHLERLPFIWFWPAGASSAAIMTHDVETEQGKQFCSTLMDINSSFDIKSSFQLIPEKRYHVTADFLKSLRDRGFEVAIHDLNHDGHLYRNKRQFLERVPKINSYGKKFKANGFRAGVLYRRQIWYDALDFSYDMSVPNAANFDPQQGGCCTVIPYFLGRVLELPVTTTQDYTLFHLLNDYSINLWKQQIELIMSKNGLVSVIVHPDYILESREQQVYKELLGHLNKLRSEKSLWITTPGEIDQWWRQRAELKIVESGGEWKIEGKGKERARIAYATERDGKLVFTF